MFRSVLSRFLLRFQPFTGYGCRYIFCDKTVYSQAFVIDSTLTKCTIPANDVSCNNKIKVTEVSMNNVKFLSCFSYLVTTATFRFKFF